jgi:hypothetical protein
MRWFVLGLLILIAAPTVVWGDAEDELECQMLVRRGDDCVEYVWEDPLNDVIQQGSARECRKANAHEVFKGSTAHIPSSCKCNRRAYQDFGPIERIKYHWCK